jgi:hypothetical protein
LKAEEMVKLWWYLPVCSMIAATAIAAPRVCTDKPPSLWLPEEQLVSRLKKQGYKLREFEYERHCIEIKGWDKNGQRVWLAVDPTDGRVVTQKIEHPHE